MCRSPALGIPENVLQARLPPHARANVFTRVRVWKSRQGYYALLFCVSNSAILYIAIDKIQKIAIKCYKQHAVLDAEIRDTSALNRFL